MEELSLDNVIEMIENNELSYNQFYNAEIDAAQYYSTKHYKQYTHDNLDIDQKLRILFLDIEVYKCDLEIFRNKKQSSGPINSVAIFDSKTKTYYVFILLMMTKNANLIDLNNKDEIIQKYKKELIEEKYLKEDENIQLFFFIDEELQMIEKMWQLIHYFDPTILTGFNSHYFDYPYIYYRLMVLYNNDENKVDNLLSKFGVVKKRGYGSGDILQIAEYPICDVRRLYMPRSESGLNYGRTLSSYSLDFIAEKELGIRKVEYDGSLDQLYERDPINFIKYNIGDTALTVRLEEKLQIISLHNMLRRDMTTSFTSSMIGASALFSSMFNYELSNLNIGMRWGILQETTNSIDETQLSNIELPKEKSIKWNITKIDETDYRKILTRYVGAYVKEGIGKIVTLKDGILVDMDASLPPWEKIFIKRHDFIYWIEIGYYIFQEGDETLTWDENNNSCWRKVLGKTKHNWDGQLVKIETETGKEGTVTTNHSIFGIKKGIKTNVVRQIDANNLEKGDYILGLKQFNPEGKLTSVNPELIGFWLSDGWSASKNDQKYIAKQDKELLEIFAPFIKNIRLKRKASDKYKEEWIGNIDDPIKTELNDFFIDTKRKNFQHILNYTKEHRQRIWNGMMFADGTLTGLNSNDVIIPSERLCKYRNEERNECFIVAHTIGWKPRNNKSANGVTNVHTKPDGSSRYGLDQVCPEVFKYYKGACYKLQKNNMSHNCRHTLNKIKHIIPEVENIYTDTTGLEKIKSVEYIDYSGEVYDLSVEGTERFFAGSGIGCHNTALYPLI